MNTKNMQKKLISYLMRMYLMGAAEDFIMIDEKKLLENRPEYLNPNMDDEIKSAHNKGWNDCNKY